MTHPPVFETITQSLVHHCDWCRELMLSGEASVATISGFDSHYLSWMRPMWHSAGSEKRSTSPGMVRFSFRCGSIEMV